jgi:hypothetical protein
MARTQLVRLAILLLSAFSSSQVFAGDIFTGYQNDHKGQYFSYLGVRAPLMKERDGFQPFLQVFGSGLGYTFKDNGQERDANLQSVTPSLGLKYTVRSWTWIGMAGPQFRWKQEEPRTGPRTHEQEVGGYVQLEALRWHEQGTFHAIASYTDLDGFFFGRLRGTRLVHESGKGCCSTYLGWDLAGMGNKDFYAVQTGPLVQVPVDRFYLTLKGGYQYTQTFHNGVYGGVELYVPF